MPTWRERAMALSDDYQTTRLAEQKSSEVEENRRLRRHLLELRRQKAELLGEMAAARTPNAERQEIESLLTPIPPAKPGY